MKNSIHWLAINGFLCTLAVSELVATAKTNDQVIGPQNTEVAREEFAQVSYVSQTTGSDTEGDGTKSNPWNSLQKALAEAPHASANSRSAILLSEGVYSGKEIQMLEFIDLYGGFDPANWERDIFRHATAIEGQDQCRIIIAADHARLDGFVFQGAKVRSDGAVILCDGTSPTITNNRFQNNQTLAPLNWQPEYLHEKAHDGGAICARNAAAPTIANNLFIENRTEIGRGAAIAFYSHCEGTIRNNVFLHNETGLKDEDRSSDGGAVSLFEWSKPLIKDNLFIENQALAQNDGGALFIALWSSPTVTGNTFVGNKSSDDGGALFIGGQEHRYDRELDPLPNAEEYFVLVKDNLFCGNSNPKVNSGGIRMTMQSRAKLVNNILAEKNQLYIQASEVYLTNNTFLEDMILIQFTSQLAPRLIANNIMWGNLVYDSETPITLSNIRDGYPGQGNFDTKPMLDQEQSKLNVIEASFDSHEYVTTVEIADSNWGKNELAGRIVESDRRWTVVKSNHSNHLVLWGDQSHVDHVNLLPTYRLRSNSPCIDRGSDEHAPRTDIDGDRRPIGHSSDIGADEFVP